MLWMIKLGYYGDSIGLPWIPLFLSFLLVQVAGSCPRDVTPEADACFADYNTHLQNMKMSSQRLCCGVDVEILRAFCRFVHAATTARATTHNRSALYENNRLHSSR
ncbi:uncharacterized protein LOC121368037 [Gigantopelta aegis]|uniref:uncharacterized protein LOC121368037 n=1 Tax=Gigantopelta aegis TaxID=1735272 RepID=UPI001B88D4D4|nr:uncharacterized protein LOC121368037 [Gigantopelta aegis]